MLKFLSLEKRMLWLTMSKVFLKSTNKARREPLLSRVCIHLCWIAISACVVDLPGRQPNCHCFLQCSLGFSCIVVIQPIGCNTIERSFIHSIHFIHSFINHSHCYSIYCPSLIVRFVISRPQYGRANATGLRPSSVCLSLVVVCSLYTDCAS